MSEVKVNLLGDEFEKKINDSINKIEELKNEKQQKEDEINKRIKKAERNYERTDSEILKKQAEKDEREAKKELTKTAKVYDTEIAEEQAKIKALVQESKKRIEEERKNAEDKMKELHSNIKSWSEDEKTKKRLKARQSIRTSIAVLKELLDMETDENARNALEQQIESLKANISKGAYTAYENDTKLTEFKKLAKEANEYYNKLSDSLDKLDELEELQSQLDDMGIETEDKDYSQENSDAWKKFVNKYNKYVERISKPLLSNIERNDFKTKIGTKVRKLQSDLKNSNGNIDYTAKIEELSSEFDTYYKNLNISRKSELNEKLENAAGKLSETPNLADELRSEFAGKITALNTDDLLMLEDAKNISSDMDKKIKEIEDRQNSAYPQEIIDAFDKFDKLCDEVKRKFEKQEDVDNEMDVYESEFETQRTEWKTAIDNKEEIDVKKIQEKYVDLDKRLTVYKENIKKLKLVKDASLKKIEQAKTNELEKVKENLNDIIGDKFDEVIKIIEKFDGTPIDVNEIIKIIEAYTVPEQIDLDPPELSDDEKAKREAAHDRAGKANDEFQKNDKITPEDKKDAMNNMAILDIHLYDVKISKEDYIKECDDFIDEINRIKEEQTKGRDENKPPKNKSAVDKLTVAKIEVNVKAGLYILTMKSGDEIVVPTRKLQDREKEKTAAEIREEYGISMELLDPDRVKANINDAAKNLSGYGIGDKRTEEGKRLKETGLVDPVIASILLSCDNKLESIDRGLKNTNKSKYVNFIIGEKLDIDVVYDFKDVNKVKNNDINKSMKYLGKIARAAQSADREDMLVNLKKKKLNNRSDNKQDKANDKEWKEYYKLYDGFYTELESEGFNNAKSQLEELFGNYENNKKLQPEEAYEKLRKTVRVVRKNITTFKDAIKKLNHIDSKHIDKDDIELISIVNNFEDKWMQEIEKHIDVDISAQILKEINEITDKGTNKTKEQQYLEYTRVRADLHADFDRLTEYFEKHKIQLPEDLKKAVRNILALDETKEMKVEDAKKIKRDIVNAIENFSVLDQFKTKYENIAEEKMSGFLQRGNRIKFTKENYKTYREYVEKIKLVNGIDYIDEIKTLIDDLETYLEDEKTTENENPIGDEHKNEEPEKETTELYYKDLSERAKRVYNNVETSSKEEKKALIEEEALKGRITPEDHKQLHEIFDLGPLPVAEKKPNILKRAWNGLKDRASAFFFRKDEEAENDEPQEPQKTGEDNINENIVALNKVYNEYSNMYYKELTDEIERKEFNEKFRKEDKQPGISNYE